MKSKIVVIEDNEDSLYMMKFILEKSGYQVVTAQNGEEGIEAVCRERPDLVVLDIQLPVMSGYEVARQLKRRPGSRDAPIVAVTSFAMQGDRESILAAGCDGYVQKPIDPDTFVASLEEYLK